MLGPRASGKSSVKKILEIFKSEVLKQSMEKYEEKFIKVYLNGLVLTDDRLVLKEIVKQLNSKEGAPNCSFADNLRFVLSVLQEGSRKKMPVVFILDEFDLFAHHSRQSLLYNLFDISQSSPNPVSVIGLSARIDCLDLLEKRVKSRFSHRIVHFYPLKSFNEFVSLAKVSFDEQFDPLFENETMSRILQNIFHTSKNIRLFYRVAIPVIAAWSGKGKLYHEDFEISYAQQHFDGKILIMTSKSENTNE